MNAFANEMIAWLGHDTFKVSASRALYFDPYQIRKPDHAHIIFITHDHFDHCSPDDIAKIQKADTLVVAPPDCLPTLSGNKKAIRVGEHLSLDGVEVSAVPAYNTNKEFHPRSKGWLGYIVTIDGTRIYHAGDTDLIPEMKNVKADIALLPVSGTYVMTPDEAARAALDIHPSVAIPMHYGSVVGKDQDAKRFSDLLAGKIEVILKPRQ